MGGKCGLVLGGGSRSPLKRLSCACACVACCIHPMASAAASPSATDANNEGGESTVPVNVSGSRGSKRATPHRLAGLAPNGPRSSQLQGAGPEGDPTSASATHGAAAGGLDHSLGVVDLQDRRVVTGTGAFVGSIDAHGGMCAVRQPCTTCSKASPMPFLVDCLAEEGGERGVKIVQ